MKKISVIVPAYNAEKYIEKCLNSILNQTLEDIELIVINDESKDKTLSILKNYEQQYSKKIKIIDQKNSGPGGARNAGLKIASGEYIAFVDGDDYIAPDMLEKLYQKAKEEDFDVVVCDNYIVYPDQTTYQRSGIEMDLKKEKDIKKAMIHSYAVLWNKIYKKSILEKTYFIEGVYYEDIEYLHRIFPKIHSIGVIKKALYYYIQQEGSITYTYNKKLYDIIHNFNGLIEYYQKMGYYKSYKEELEYSYVRYAYATFLNRLAKTKNKKEFKKGVNYVASEVQTHFPNYKKNKYIKEQGKKNFYLRNFNRVFAKLLYCFSKNRGN